MLKRAPHWAERIVLFAAASTTLALAGCGDSGTDPSPPKIAPDSPSALATERVSGTSIRLEWIDNSDNENGFRIVREEYAGFVPEVVVAEIDANGTGYLDAGVQADMTYTYHVEAFNDAGKSALRTTAAGSTLPSYLVLYAGIAQPGLGSDGVGEFDAQFYYPIDLTFGPDGVPYVLDWNNHRIRAFGPTGLYTVLGTGILGEAPAGGLASATPINHPTHVTFDASGGMIVSAWHNSKLIRIDMESGVVSGFCGDGVRRYTGDGMPALTASINLPSSTAFDAQGRLYISDQENQLVRRIELDGTISRIVGALDLEGRAEQAGFEGDGGLATEAKIFSRGGQAADPQARLTVGPDNRLYLCDSGNNRVRVVDLTTGIIDTYAGSGGITGYFDGDGGPATSAQMFFPADLAFGPDGNLYIADTYNHCIRMVDTATGIITTVVGAGGIAGVVTDKFEGTGGTPTEGRLFRPYGIAFDAKGRLFITDSNNSRILVAVL